MDGTWWDGIVRGLVRAALAVYRVLVVYGALWVPMPDDQLGAVLGAGPASGADRPGAASDGAASPTRPRRLAVRRPAHRMAGPPPGHPERLRNDVPLTPLERRLRRELGRRQPYLPPDPSDAQA